MACSCCQVCNGIEVQMCVKKRGHASLFRIQGEAVDGGRGESVLPPSPGDLRPLIHSPRETQSWAPASAPRRPSSACGFYEQGRYLPSRGPGQVLRANLGAPPPTHMGPWPSLQYYQLPLPLLSAWLHTSRALWAGGKAPGHRRVEKTSLSLPSPGDRPSNPSSDGCHWSC